ncbi:MAG: hypothetical protein ABFE01_26335 [Phycisphaerales bacterium]|jgi:hypothetical protein
MKRTAVLPIVAVVAGVLVLGAVALFSGGGPDPVQFERLKQPQIRTMADQKVLVVETKGDPTVVGGKAFSLVFDTYFRLKGVPKRAKNLTPRARWPLGLDAPKDQWLGRYAMPVPESVTSLPQQSAEASELHAELATWEYGEVAEILHVGPYSREEPTIRRLTDFIKDSGYAIVGEHEEEYVKGPGVWSRGDPEKYLTIIRYRVKKAQ